MVHNRSMSTRTQVRIEQDLRDDSALLTALTEAYERGWQPADLLHATRRSLGAGEIRPAVRAIRHEALLSEAAARAPRKWLDQVAEITTGLRMDRPDESNVLQHTALTMLWRHLPRLPVECPTPSQWPCADTEPTRNRAAPHPAALDRIRRLLAPAETCEFTEQAETLTAKAQELITTLTATGMLQQDRGTEHGRIEVRCHRIHLHNPYVKEKAQLLSEVGRCNTVRTVWFTRLGIATIIGVGPALDHVELLYNSLLVQANNAMRDASRKRPTPSSTAFRRAYLYGFAIRMGTRLYQTHRTVIQAMAGRDGITASEVTAALRRRTTAVDTGLLRLLPEIRTIPARSGGHPRWYPGRMVTGPATGTDPTPNDPRWSPEALISV